MYGPVLGASVTAGAVTALPTTSGSKLSMLITLGCLAVGVAIVTVASARILASKIFNA